MTEPLEETATSLTSDAYRRWLRAQRPPFVMFLGLSEDEQEHLAQLGEEHALDVIEGFAAAMSNPSALVSASAAAEVAGSAVPTEQEVDLVTRVATESARRILGAGAVARPTMAGMSERRAARVHREAAEKRLFGRPGTPTGSA